MPKKNNVKNKVAEKHGKGVFRPRVAIVGGGTGIFSVLSGLRGYDFDLTAVVSMADDGGSSGILREEFGILPPGDVRRAIVAMSRSDDRLLSDLFNYRFEEGGFKGHNFGNIMLTALQRICGSFEQAVDEAGRILGVCGRVLPVTLKKVRLCAKLENGDIIRGETNIDIPKHDGNLKIRKVWLEPRADLNARAKDALLSADMIVIGPGDLYTSIVPNLLVDGMRDVLKKAKAKKVYVVNLMTKFGETNGFSGRKFIETVEKYAGKGLLDYAIINSRKPSSERLKYYEKEAAEFVAFEDLPSRPVPVIGDFLRRSGFVRHDPVKLAKSLLSLLEV